MSTSEGFERGVGRPLWEGHRDRLRRRMEREGWEALKPHEMVELVLYHAVPRQDLSDISRLLVGRFGSVGGVFSASRERLMAVEGMTPVMTEWILATGELMRAYYDAHARKGIRLSCRQEVVDYIRARADEMKGAGFWALYADFDFNLITFSADWPAEPWSDAENARKMVVEAVDSGARYAFLVRFDGQRRIDMGEGDDASLESLAVALRAVDVDLLDFLLVNGAEIRSMNAEGSMKNLRENPGVLALHERYLLPISD